MTKSELIKQIAERAELTQAKAAEALQAFEAVVTDELSKGGEIALTGFGTFKVTDRAARTGRNPQTGEAMEITARRVLTFKPSQVLKEDVTIRYAHRLDNEGNEDKSIPAKEGTARALSSFMSNTDDSMEGDDDFDMDDDNE